jgi:hypothetical protein
MKAKEQEILLNFSAFIEKIANCGYNKVVLVFCGWAHCARRGRAAVKFTTN